MRKILSVAAGFAVMLCGIICIACSNHLSEIGEWKLAYFGDGEKNYSVGEEYGGTIVADDFYTCSFDGVSYKVYKCGAVIKAGEYFAEEVGGNSVMLALKDGSDLLYWNLGLETQTNGEEIVRIFGQLDDFAVSFIPA